MTVYVLEDDSAVLDSLTQILESRGLEVRGFPDAETFFANVVPVQSDIVIVDIVLPGINGAQVIRWVKNLADRPQKILAISGQVKTKLTDHLHDLPDIQVIDKPLFESELELHLGNEF